MLAVAWSEMQRSTMLGPTQVIAAMNLPYGVPTGKRETEPMGNAVLVNTQRT
ncbi:MAG: hypothetical protein ACKOEM_00370 [Planctomycetia bacterium]